MESFDAYVAAAVFLNGGRASEPVFALGDGTVRFGEAVVAAHDGAILCATPHPSGEGLLTGGDDGRLVLSTPEGAQELHRAERGWIDAVAASRESGLIACAQGRRVVVVDARNSGFRRELEHERRAAGLAFDAKGLRLAVATYGGVHLWRPRIAGETTRRLAWAGSHVAVAFSPDGRFVVSAMQENALHGWRLEGAVDLRMGGYPAKPRSFAFLARGALLATSGASGAVVWPFSGPSGPMGKEAAEVGAEPEVLVTRVAAPFASTRLAAGLSDGRVWARDLKTRAVRWIRAETGAAVSALAASADGARLAWGAEDGAAGVAALDL